MNDEIRRLFEALRRAIHALPLGGSVSRCRSLERLTESRMWLLAEGFEVRAEQLRTGVSGG